MKLKLIEIGIYFGIVLLLIGCKTNNSALFYNLSDFNLNAGNEFIAKIDSINEITKISIVDTRTEENAFSVNGQLIFNDTLQQNQPNFYNYVKRANELNIEHKKLTEVLTIFKQIKVSEYIRENEFYNFPVEKYALSKHNGYLYNKTTGLKVGDTIRIDRNIYNTFILKKKIAENWFEYESEL